MTWKEALALIAAIAITLVFLMASIGNLVLAFRYMAAENANRAFTSAFTGAFFVVWGIGLFWREWKNASEKDKHGEK